MKYKFILLALSILAVSCEKITNVTLVDGAHTGTLSYKLSDDAGKGLIGVKVSVYVTPAYTFPTFPDPDTFVRSVRTDQDGVANFSELPSMNYLVIADSAMLNGARYRTNEYVQIVAGKEKSKTVNVTDFAGILSIRVLSNRDYSTPLKNVGVVAFAFDQGRPNSATVRDFITNATFKGVTDQNGYVSIKVPYGERFGFIVHEPNGNLGYGYDTHSVEKGRIADVRLYY